MAPAAGQNCCLPGPGSTGSGQGWGQGQGQVPPTRWVEVLLQGNQAPVPPAGLITARAATRVITAEPCSRNISCFWLKAPSTKEEAFIQPWEVNSEVLQNQSKWEHLPVSAFSSSAVSKCTSSTWADGPYLNIQRLCTEHWMQHLHFCASITGGSDHVLLLV